MFEAPVRLEQLLLQEGCFLAEQEGMASVIKVDHCHLSPDGIEVVLSKSGAHDVVGRWKLNPVYNGRFKPLAEAYELDGQTITQALRTISRDGLAEYGIVTLSDYLISRWIAAFHALMAQVGDGKIAVRAAPIVGEKRESGVAFPAECVTDAIHLDHFDWMIWEAPEPASASGSMPRRWVDITVNWDDVLRQFAPLPGPNAESKCVKWLGLQMQASPKHRPKVRRDFLREALGKFEGLTKESFGRAWKTAISENGAEAWSRGGAPKKNPREKSSEKK